MKIFSLLFCILFASNSYSQEFDKLNIELLGRWTIPEDKVNEFGTKHSSCWGYASKGREYAIVGCSNGTAYIDVTDPAVPQFIDFVPSRVKNATWREYKTYKHYAYQVSDDFGDNHFDIVDLSYLPDSVHIAYSGKEYFTNAHTIFIDGSKMYTGGARMGIYSLENDPTKPEIILKNATANVHDMYVRNDTIYASKGSEGLLIYVLKNEQLEQIGSYANYPFLGGNHSSILTPNGKTLIFADEYPQSLPAKSIDVSDINNPVFLDTFYSQSRKATLHNPFLALNNKFVMASYLDGVQVYDYSNPADIKLTGYFDTHWQSITPNVHGAWIGAWSAYTELPSKNLIVVDMVNGLYVLDASKAYFPEVMSKNSLKNATKITTYPNPSTQGFQVEIPIGLNGKVEVKIINVSGQLIYHNIMDLQNLKQHTFSSENWASGVYLIQLSQGQKVFVAEQIIK